jgi:transcriptional regulator with XRE-family HTH domain
MSKRKKLPTNNICGKWIRYVRKGLYGKNHPKMTQEELTAKLQILGLKIDRTALSRIESGTRVLSDIEVYCFAYVLKVPFNFLYFGPDEEMPPISELTALIADED